MIWPEKMTLPELLLEFLMNALRLRQRILMTLITERTGLTPEDIYKNLMPPPNGTAHSLRRLR